MRRSHLYLERAKKQQYWLVTTATVKDIIENEINDVMLELRFAEFDESTSVTDTCGVIAR